MTDTLKAQTDVAVETDSPCPVREEIRSVQRILEDKFPTKVKEVAS